MGRNLYEPEEMLALGFEYRAIGRAEAQRASSATTAALKFWTTGSFG